MATSSATDQSRRETSSSRMRSRRNGVSKSSPNQAGVSTGSRLLAVAMAPLLGVAQLRVLVGGNETVPADVGAPRRRREAAVPAEAARAAAERRPQHVAVGRSHHQVLGREDVRRHALADLVGGASSRQRHEGRHLVRRLPAGPGHAARRQAAARVGREQVAAVGAPHLDLLDGAAGDADRLAFDGDRQPAAVARDALAALVELLDEDVDVVDVEIGQRPGDVRPTAEDDRRRTGQRHAGGVVVRRHDPRLVPDVGQAEREVRVVGEER
jgi:hypothetical protein